MFFFLSNTKKHTYGWHKVCQQEAVANKLFLMHRTRLVQVQAQLSANTVLTLQATPYIPALIVTYQKNMSNSLIVGCCVGGWLRVSTL